MDKKDVQDNRQWLQWMGLGMEYCGTLAIFGYGGYKADQHFNTEPWCLIGAFLFALTGLLYLTIKRALNQERSRDNNQRRTS